MRSKLAFSFGLLIILLLSFLLPGRSTQAVTASPLFVPTDVGGLPPLLNISKLLGSDRSNRTLHMSASLALRNQAQLNALLRDIYDPSSPNYHHYLTVDQFAQQFGPTAYQQQAVENYLARQGFTITQTYANHLLIDFSGSESLAERTFGVTINDYRSPAGRDFFSNATVPTLPAYLAGFVNFIGGLDNANQFFHPPIASRYNSSAPVPGAAGNCPSAGAGGGGGSQVAYIPSQFAKAYNYDGLHSAGLQGNGQTVGVFELDGYSQSDVQAIPGVSAAAACPLKTSSWTDSMVNRGLEPLRSNWTWKPS